MITARTIEFRTSIQVEDPGYPGDDRDSLPVVFLHRGSRLSGVMRHCVFDIRGIPVECFTITEASGRVLGPIQRRFIRFV